MSMSDEAQELQLYIDNEEGYYRGILYANGTLAQHYVRGTYTANRAPKAFATIVAEAAKSYQMELGSPFGGRRFSAADRREVCEDYAQQFIAIVRQPEVWGDLGERAVKILTKGAQS